jgi:hypothetical protein
MRVERTRNLARRLYLLFGLYNSFDSLCTGRKRDSEKYPIYPEDPLAQARSFRVLQVISQRFEQRIHFLHIHWWRQGRTKSLQLLRFLRK